MFSGIVQTRLPVAHIEKRQDLHRLSFDFGAELLTKLKIGASVAVNGTCLTVCEIVDGRVSFDVMMETLRVTNLGALQEAQNVNIERAARFDDEIGGHMLSGHVHTQLEILAIERPENNCVISFSLPPQWQAYIFPKGFVSLNGCSLTVGEVEQGRFNVYLIPETLKVTVFGQCEVGDKVNLEVDSQTQAVVDTVKRMAQAGALQGLV